MSGPTNPNWLTSIEYLCSLPWPWTPTNKLWPNQIDICRVYQASGVAPKSMPVTNAKFQHGKRKSFILSYVSNGSEQGLILETCINPIAIRVLVCPPMIPNTEHLWKPFIDKYTHTCLLQMDKYVMNGNKKCLTTETFQPPLRYWELS